MRYLKQVSYKLPNTSPDFEKNFINYLSPISKINPDGLTLRLINDSYVPKTCFIFTDVVTPQVTFLLSDNCKHHIDITNSTGQSRTNPYQYSHISIEDFIKRISPFKLSYIDHTGFNLPYFDGIHPKILELREILKDSSLYHTFPKHLEDAPWDFILPATEKEIDKSSPTDYSVIRKPKIEIVSFDKSSTPLIQIDLQLEGKFEDWEKLFPEAITIKELKNLWVYIKNGFGIDICFVLNEAHGSDWSYHFEHDRLS